MTSPADARTGTEITLLHGPLSEGAVPGILRHLYLQRATGLLHFTRPGATHTVCFGKGRIVGAIASTPEADLGATLLRSGALSSDELTRARAARARLGRPLGEVLIELGLQTRDNVETAIAAIVRSTLSDVFSWEDGTFEFEECPLTRVLRADVALKLSTAELILESVRAVSDPAAVRRGLGSTERRLTSSATPVLSVPQSSLSPSDGFVLSRVDGLLSAREIIEIAPLTAEEVERSLFGLLCVGLIEYQTPVERPVRRTDAAAATRPAGTVVSALVPERPPHQGGAAPNTAQDRPPAEAETASPEVAESYLLVAEQLRADGKHVELMAMADRVIPHMPRAAQTRLRILQARACLADPSLLEFGLKELRQIARDHPTETGTLFLVGQAYAGAGLEDHAASTMRKVLELAPGHREAVEELRRLAP